MNILNSISNLISAGHKDAIKKVFAILRSRGTGNNRQTQFEGRRLGEKTSKADGKQVFLPVRVAKESKISSDDHNENMENIFIDLLGIYTQVDFLGNLHNKQSASIFDDYFKARAAILKLINDTRVFALRSRLPQFDDVKLVNFNISNNKTALSPSAIVDPDSRLLKLPAIIERRNHLEHRGGRRTTLDVEIIGGTQGQLGKQFTAPKAVDSKASTFWAEVIYSSVPTHNTYNRWGPNKENKFIEEVNGPIVKYTLTFSGAEPVNQIKIFPFSNYPVKVLEITYKPTASSLIRKSILDFQVEESLDWIEYNFETIHANDVEVVFTQENYRTLIVHVPRHILYATDFLVRLNEERAREIGELPDLQSVNLGGNHEIYQEALDELSTFVSNKELSKTPVTEIDLAGKTILSLAETLTSFSPGLKELLEEVSNYTDRLPENTVDKIDTINRYEYILGAREIECNYNIYSPIGYYESEKFDPVATITNIELEVDEKHPTFLTQFGEINRTSTEWSVELAEDRVINIFPSNHVIDGYLKVNNERLIADPDTRFGLSRFSAQLNFALVRENDEILVANTDYTLEWKSEEFAGRLKITIDKNRFNRNKIYTIDYFADPSSKSIDVSATFEDKSLVAPDVFESTGPNNDIKLSVYPFINYGIVNHDDFSFNSKLNAYEYTAPTGAYTEGLAEITPNWIVSGGTFLTGLTGSLTVFGRTGIGSLTAWDTLDASFFTAPHNYYLKITNLPGAIYEISSFDGTGQLTLENVPELFTGVVGNEIDLTGEFVGNILTGGTPPTGYITVPYSIEVIYQDGDQIFGFDNTLYKPINITVGGVEAKNTTEYQSLEQPAFNVAETQDGEYEFIHDGKTIYFNQPIAEAEIQADYRWLTKYAKVNCILRTNKIVSPTVSPIINEYRLLLNTSIL